MTLNRPSDPQSQSEMPLSKGRTRKVCKGVGSGHCDGPKPEADKRTSGP
ncbi:hypothetical protein C8K44_11969 [Aminobacter sp. AP02]|nr:hypothetical protein C8K44_11969 [Aminobacter sp. AP02]